jgi:putative ABC transport system permease protein
LSRLRAFFRRERESVLEEEVTAHLELQTRKYIRAGMSVEQARRRARVEFGGLERVKEECRDVRRARWLSNVTQDLRYAIRMFRHARGFAGLVVLMLALGIGANLAIFSVMDAILLRMLPVRDPASLFRTVGASGNPYGFGGGGSYPVYREMQKRTSRFADLMAYQAAEPAPIAIGNAESGRLMHQVVSGNYFEVLGVEPAAGRMISSTDESGRHAVAVVSYRLWQTRFDKSERAIGDKLRSGDRTFEIIGVTPPGFVGVEIGKMVDVWTPVPKAPAENLRIMGRLHAGVTIAQAAAPMQAVMNEIMLDDVRHHAPPGTPKQVIDRFLAGMRIIGVPAGGGISYLRRQYRQPLSIMMFVVGLVLLIACSSVANLLIARGSARQQEIAIRLSLGAHRRRILQQLITESLLLAFLSAGLGLLLARWGTPLLVRLLAPSGEPAKLATGMDPRLLAFASLLSLLTILICGLLPALRLVGTDMHAAIKNGTRLTATGSERVSRFLAASQVALSLVLVTGAVLFTRTLVNLVSSQLGFDARSVLVTHIALRRPRAEKNLVPAWNELLRYVRGLPGVEQASLSSAGLFTGEPPLGGIRTTAAKALPADPTTGQLFVSAGYFQTLGIQFVAGRDFESRDNDFGSPPRVIVNEVFVRKFFGNENPLGRQLTKLANAPVWTGIAGIVKDAKFGNLREAAPPMIYIPYGRITDWIRPQARPGESMFLQVRGRQSMSSLAADLRREIGQRFTIGEISRQQQLIDDTLVRERLLASVASLFGGLALILAALGLYGIMSYAVTRRRRELGIRMALGAAPAAILGLMLRDSAMIIGLGTVAGVVVAGFSAHLAKALLFGFAPNDPTTFIAAALLLLIASLTAVFIPAYRAAETDPMIALCQE